LNSTATPSEAALKRLEAIRELEWICARHRLFGEVSKECAILEMVFIPLEFLKSGAIQGSGWLEIAVFFALVAFSVVSLYTIAVWCESEALMT
jgi:hypothetical protein